MVIPDDISFAILSKLPLKSLKRFTLLHKSCADLLEIPHFMTMFRNNFLSQHQSRYDDTSLLLLQQPETDDCHYQGSLYLLSGDKLEKTLISDSLPYQQEYGFIRFLGSGIHGILCLHEAPDYKFVLWNPTTNECRVTPPSPRESLPHWEADITPHGFGYDPVTDDFKVIRHIKFYRELVYKVDREPDEDKDEPTIPDQLPMPCPTPQPFWEIYSLRSNSWRKLNADMPINLGGPGLGYDIYMNGVCHWIGYSQSDDYLYLVSFNFSNEIFDTTPLPSLDDIRWPTSLAVLNESIALITVHNETETLHILILGELGVKESWSKLFIVEFGCYYFGIPMRVEKTGGIFFTDNNDAKLALFDLSTQMLKEISYTGLEGRDTIIIYKESILPIGRTVAGEGIGEVRVSPGCHC